MYHTSHTDITNLDIDLRVFLPKLIEGDYKKRLTAKTAMDNAWLNKTQNSLITRSQKTKLAQQMLAYDVPPLSFRPRTI
jgi:hypothetical protein